MAIITLTTDLGDKDFYQAALKGSILSLLPAVSLIDITHNISAFNISEAAFVLKNAFPYFPKNSVHLIGIDSVYNQNTRYLAIRYRDHFFVGSDNGIFSLLFEEDPQEIVELHIMQDLKFLHFPLTDIFAKAATHLAKGGKISEIGLPVSHVEEKMSLQPVIERDIIRGSVIYIDSFQNVITNITKDLFTRVQRNRNFALFFRRNESITQLSWHYNEVPEGEKLCLFGISNYLEIAINKGNASGLLGLNLGDIVRIEFYSEKNV
ncbi:SAM-dependent chlorinase/fluorinase [Pedobacter sp. BS3]|uniref:SAM hydrolase/SAM-dependent halogenase family protein n=1 Tax=Pedobacter sp. BS3 TaxID=2567937 RepID=UPI0011ECCAE2|nr:SAM-dependent chlorinase/fluorinase [Pedobacter sp. BS3]TZF82724.1 SAM-dependent chlorinase/fluorinase [Pedobacter sp. BS3]